MKNRWNRTHRWVQAASAATVCLLCLGSTPRPAVADTLDYQAPPGANYDAAEFRLWFPDDAGTLRGVVLLVPGSNGDGRSMTEESVWREFAVRHDFALLGSRITDKRHDQMFIEHYIDVSQGSGQALLDGLAILAERSGHPELEQAPFVSWGMSAGGEFNYELAVWKPERTIAFILNKGGIYYTALASPAARQVPGLLFIGETDLAFRNDIIKGLFAVNRRAGALWALVEEPGVGHAVNRSRDMALLFFDEMIQARLPAAPAAVDGAVDLRPIDPSTGYYGSLETWTFEPAADAGPPRVPAAWLPTESIARAWQAVRQGQPF